MNIEHIIKNLYEAFKDCPRPDHFTKHDHCIECEQHDLTMLSATLETLDSKHLGSSGWAAWSFLTPKGFSHYMPRILELAIRGKCNKHGDLFLNDILYQLAPNKDLDRFEAYSNSQCNAVLDALIYASDKFEKELNESYSMEDMANAQAYWSARSS